MNTKRKESNSVIQNIIIEQPSLSPRSQVPNFINTIFVESPGKRNEGPMWTADEKQFAEINRLFDDFYEIREPKNTAHLKVQEMLNRLKKIKSKTVQHVKEAGPAAGDQNFRSERS